MRITESELLAGALSPETLSLSLRTFRDVGYLVLENAYEHAFIDSVRDAYSIALEKYLDSKGGLDALDGKTFGKGHIGFFPALFGPMADTRLAAHPIAVQLMRELLGKNFQCAFYHTNTAMPGSGVQPIHRDCQPLFGTELQAHHPVATLVLNVPLCDFTLENGSTEVWPGTHLIVDSSPEEKNQLDARAAELPSARTNVPVGSLILRDMRLWHRGMPNHSDASRTMFAIVYERDFIRTPVITIPKTTWDAWSIEAQHIFRFNTVVPDAEHTPRVWG
jgi:hypothetical protein